MLSAKTRKDGTEISLGERCCQQIGRMKAFAGGQGPETLTYELYRSKEGNNQYFEILRTTGGTNVSQNFYSFEHVKNHLQSFDEWKDYSMTDLFCDYDGIENDAHAGYLAAILCDLKILRRLPLGDEAPARFELGAWETLGELFPDPRGTS